MTREGGVASFRRMRAAARLVPSLMLLATVPAAADPLGHAIADRAQELVGLPSVRSAAPRESDDCTGLVRLVYGENGIDLREVPARPGENGVSALFRAAQKARAFHRAAPREGDIVFFRETYDRNRDGKRNDGLTHVGVVASVDPDGEVTFVHRIRAGIARSRLSLRHPQRRALNDVLRRGTAASRPYLAGELLTGFASPGPLRKVAAEGRAPPRPPRRRRRS